MSHTKGPWEVVKHKRFPFQLEVKSADGYICDMEGLSDDDMPTVDANARLIAAAPELYEALTDKRFGSTAGFLRKIAKQLEDEAQQVGEEWHSIYAPRLNAIADEMDAAIAKAEGRQ